MIELQEPLNSLFGGIEKGILTNICGEPGTGKTNICIIASLTCLMNGGKVIYIDTENGLHMRRVEQIAANFENVKKRMKIKRVESFEEQGKLIKKLSKIDFNLFILDSAVALYRLECANFKDETLDINRKLSIQMSTISNVCAEKGAYSIITTHVYRNWNDDKLYIIGGDSIRYWSKVILLLEKTNRMGVRKATLLKHPHKEEGKSVKFEIYEKGIRPVKRLGIIRY